MAVQIVGVGAGWMIIHSLVWPRTQNVVVAYLLGFALLLDAIIIHSYIYHDLATQAFHTTELARKEHFQLEQRCVEDPTTATDDCSFLRRH
jgi:hypothetical protein